MTRDEELAALDAVRRGQSPGKHETTVLIAHGTAYVRTSDSRLKLTPVGRERLAAAGGGAALSLFD